MELELIDWFQMIKPVNEFQFYGNTHIKNCVTDLNVLCHGVTLDVGAHTAACSAYCVSPVVTPTTIAPSS